MNINNVISSLFNNIMSQNFQLSFSSFSSFNENIENSENNMNETINDEFSTDADDLFHIYTKYNNMVKTMSDKDIVSHESIEVLLERKKNERENVYTISSVKNIYSNMYNDILNCTVKDFNIVKVKEFIDTCLKIRSKMEKELLNIKHDLKKTESQKIDSEKINNSLNS